MVIIMEWLRDVLWLYKAGSGIQIMTSNYSHMLPVRTIFIH